MGTQKARDMSIVPEGVSEDIVQKPGQEIKKEKVKSQKEKVEKKKIEKAPKEDKEKIGITKRDEKEIEKEKTEKVEKPVSAKTTTGKHAKKIIPIRKKPAHGKNYQEKLKLIDRQRKYSLDEALELALKTSPTKFDANIEVHFNLGIKLSQGKAQENLRTEITLPHPVTTKKKVIAVFTEKPKEAKSAGADFAGADELIEQVQKGRVKPDIAIATPDLMPKIAKLAKILGPKGLMPNPKSGTISEKPEQLIKKISAGSYQIKSDLFGNIHLVLGKISSKKSSLKENFLAIFQTIKQNKPSGIKGEYPKSITINACMGPGIKIDPAQIEPEKK